LNIPNFSLIVLRLFQPTRPAALHKTGETLAQKDQVCQRDFGIGRLAKRRMQILVPDKFPVACL
jgi:hypothetical protein